MRKIKEWLNIQLVKNPGRMVLGAILLFNVVLFLVSALIISGFSLTGTEDMSFLEAAFCTITMILDPGCIQFVIADIGAAGVGAVVICLAIVLIGMISFTGAVIGYITNYISEFVARANAGSKHLKISEHTVILNWNSRASEIINDLLYCETRQRVVVLVGSRKAEVEKEIHERLADTVSRENKSVERACPSKNWVYKVFYMMRHSFKKRVTVIVREGDVFSSKQLHDISLENAKIIVILGNDINNTICKFEHKDVLENRRRGNSHTVKTLMQVADITSSENSHDNQKIIVEVTDDWTAELVDRIISCKQVEQKCSIVPVRVNQVLGHILSQFSLMPELNLAYRELFSNKGSAFYTERCDTDDEIEFISKNLASNNASLPLTVMQNKGKNYGYYAAGSERDVFKTAPVKESDYTVSLNRDYWLERRNVVILGHNSRCADIMKGFEAFTGEWDYKDGSDEILRIVVIDEKSHLEKMNYYKEYPFVCKTVAAEIYDKDLICDTIKQFVSGNAEDTSVLILSDDSALNEDIDANALANLVYVQDIVREKVAENPDFDVESIDVIVEIINPKHHDIVNSYSVNNVVISNRYISKMITQIGEKEALFDFYADILTYDSDENSDSKEIYVKKVSRYFNSVPNECTAEQLVRAVYNASVDETLPPEQRSPAIVLGYVSPGGKMVLFSGDQSKIKVKLTNKDKLVMFSSH